MADRPALPEKPRLQLLITEDWYVSVAGPPEPWPETYRVTLRMITEAQKLSEQYGTKLLVMLIASTPMVEQRWEEALRGYAGAKTVTWDFARPYRAIAKLGEESGFEVIDLREPFRQDFLKTGQSHSWPHDGHWNHRGHQLAAETVAEYVLRHRAQYHLD